MIRLLTIALLIVVLAACSSAPRKRSYADGAPAENVDISKIPEPTPRAESLSKYGNRPYQVFGQWYQILPTRAGYRQQGIASWYGTKFHGKLTSTREPYDMYSFTAAHKTLPIPAYARVTNLETNRSIVVRINDRGPFVGDRIIDLSYVAAVKLGVHIKGTARVEVETITPDETAPALEPTTGNEPTIASTAPIALPSTTPRPSNPGQLFGAELEAGIYLQCGAFSDAVRANGVRIDLLNAGFSDARVIRGQDALYRVLLGPLADRATADALGANIADAGFARPSVLTHSR
jgi:rare lipoprotein A